MNDGLTLEGAIWMAEEKAKKKEEEAKKVSQNTVTYKSIKERDLLDEAAQQRQLAEWLRELKQFRKESAKLVDDGR